MRESSEKSNGRIHLSDLHSRNSRNLRHNSSTQTDIFCTDAGSSTTGSIAGDRRKGRGESEEMYKPFSTGSLHATGLRPTSELGAGRYGPSAFQECCPYTKAPSSLPFEPVTTSECVTMETALEKKHSGGTWPKMMVGGMSVAPENTGAIAAAQLSIYKSPKQRKSIFDPDTFKRPETPSSKMEYVAAAAASAAAVSHSPQPSKTDSLSSSSTPTPTPPTPPTRSDSFKFKHKHQSSSASDCTVTSDSKGEAAVATAAGESRERSERDRNGNHYFLDGKVLTSRKSCDEDIGRTRGEEPEVKRPRPKSAPALRRRMTPQTVTLPTFQVGLRDSDVDRL